MAFHIGGEKSFREKTQRQKFKAMQTSLWEHTFLHIPISLQSEMLLKNVDERQHADGRWISNKVSIGMTLKRRTLVTKSEEKSQKVRTTRKSQKNKKKKCVVCIVVVGTWVWGRKIPTCLMDQFTFIPLKNSPDVKSSRNQCSFVELEPKEARLCRAQS